METGSGWRWRNQACLTQPGRSLVSSRSLRSGAHLGFSPGWLIVGRKATIADRSYISMRLSYKGGEGVAAQFGVINRLAWYICRSRLSGEPFWIKTMTSTGQIHLCLVKLIQDHIYGASPVCQAQGNVLYLRRRLNFTTDMETNTSQSSERNAMSGAFL